MNVEFLKELLDERNISMHTLSKICGMGSGQVCKLVHQTYNDVTLSTITKIARALDLTDDEFIKLCGFKEPSDR